MNEEVPIHVRPVRSDDELRRVAALRARAYRSNSEVLADRLREPEPEDHLPGNVVFAAFDAAGLLHGTIRVHTSTFRPLPLERSVALPERLLRPRAEATRLARAFRGHPMVKLALMKAFWQYCLHRGVEVMVVAGRHPIHRQYEALRFAPVFPEWIPMAHAGGLPHKVLALTIEEAQTGWREHGHPLLGFMVGDGGARIELPPDGLGVAAA